MRLKKIYEVWNKVKKKIYYVIELPIVRHIVTKFPISNKKIVFDNFCGKGYGDNPKYIAEELINNRQEKLDIVWLVENSMRDEERNKFPSNIRLVNVESIVALYERATAKVWVDNVRHYHPVKKRKGQFYLQTWHAPFSPKCVEGDAEKFLNNNYIKNAKYDGKITDGILVNSKLQEEQFKRAFWLNENCEILRYGLPRNDEIINSRDDQSVKKRVRVHFNIDENEFVVLYAPTFRDDYSVEGYQLNFEEICSAFSKLVRKECKIIVRLHPNASFQKNKIPFSSTVIDGTDYPDIQELSLACDAVISDYSTAVFDFALLGKPAFICALDLNKYEKSRGLLKEFYSFPFPMALTNAELLDKIERFDRNKYSEDIAAYFQKYPFYDMGNASEKAALWITNKINL